MAVYQIRPERECIYGSLSAEYEPMLTIHSGDTIQYSTMDAGWGLPDAGGQRTKPYQMREGVDMGHALCGPVRIAEAAKGSTLAIRVNDLVPGPYGFTYAGQYPNWQNQKLGLTEYPELVLNWELNKRTMTARTSSIDGREFSVRLNPFMGIMGMPPEEHGIHLTWPPRPSGGNIDCKELTKGSVLYLPVPVDGAFFFVGDGHGAQGDGEMSCQAIECPMELVDLSFEVIATPEMGLELPVANTPKGWICFGFHEDLNEATVQAMDGILKLMGSLYGINRVEAIALASVAVDLRITQVVNGVKGVHALLPHGALR